MTGSADHTTAVRARCPSCGALWMPDATTCRGCGAGTGAQDIHAMETRIVDVRGPEPPAPDTAPVQAALAGDTPTPVKAADLTVPEMTPFAEEFETENRPRPQRPAFPTPSAGHSSD